MSEEQLLILKMVEEGRITAEEGVELLEALSDEDDSKLEEEDYNVWRRLEKQGEEFAYRVESAAEKFSKNLESKLEGGLVEKLSGLPKLLSKIPFVTVMGEDRHIFTDEYSGTFKSDLKTIPINLHTAYGTITVEGWEQEHYKLVATQKIRGKDRNEALQQVIDLDIPERGEQVEKLEVSIPTQKDIHISYHLYLPSKKPYLLELKSNNGKCFIQNLFSKDIKVSAYNGSITVKRVKADTLQATTNNGACVFDSVDGVSLTQKTSNGRLVLKGSGKEINCESINGSIMVKPLSIAYDDTDISLKTTNGSITCYVPKLSDVGTKVNAHTSIGQVEILLDNFVTSLNQRLAGTHQVKGEVESMAFEPKAININARVSSGSIKVLGEEEGDGPN